MALQVPRKNMFSMCHIKSTNSETRRSVQCASTFIISRHQYSSKFFLVFFACFLSLLLLAVIGWKLKTMYDLYLQRRAVLNEMREMAARPFAQVHLSTEKPIVDEPPQPVCYEILEDQSAAVATSFLLLPRHPDGSPPIGLSSLCFGSVMIAFEEKLEQDLLLPVLPAPSRNGVDNPTCTDNAPTPT